MAPLGLAFYQQGLLPKKYNHSVFIAFHGSWNRSIPSGYKILRLILNEKGKILAEEEFISGWLRPGEGKIGRPVDVEQSPNGSLFISDDYGGRVYKVQSKN